MKTIRIVAALALIAAASATTAQAATYAPAPVAVESLPDITPAGLAPLDAAAVEIAALAAPGTAPAYVAAVRKTSGFETQMLARPALAGFVALVLGATLLQLRRTWRTLESRRFGQA